MAKDGALEMGFGTSLSLCKDKGVEVVVLWSLLINEARRCCQNEGNATEWSEIGKNWMVQNARLRI